VIDTFRVLANAAAGATGCIGAHMSIVAEAKPWKGTASNMTHTINDFNIVFTEIILAQRKLPARVLPNTFGSV
jgi:hypothetical protein